MILPFRRASVTVKAALLAPMIVCEAPKGRNPVVKPPLANAPFFPFFFVLVVVVATVAVAVAGGVVVFVW